MNTYRHNGAQHYVYAIFPHNFLALLFGSVFGFAMLALAIGVVKFWREVSPTRDGTPADIKAAAQARVPAVAEAVHDVARLKYLGGGHGDGCNEDDDAFTLWRRRFHQFTLYGFLLCFASTCVATLYHYLWNLHAPYALTSAPVILGTLGGIGLIIGPIGLLWLPASGSWIRRPFIAIARIMNSARPPDSAKATVRPAFS